MSNDITTTTQQPTLLQRIELDTQVSTAKAYPRNVDASYKEAFLMATKNQEVAESCIYSLPRGGKLITGPSVRLAEILSYCWGNFQAATRPAGNTGTHVISEAVAWDLEKNVKVSVQAERSILDKYGVKYKADMQTVTSMAAGSIAFRNAVFKVIPRSFIDDIFEAAKKATLGGSDSLPLRIEKSIAHFEKIGISESDLLLIIKKGHKDEIISDDIYSLVGLANCIRDGVISVETVLGKNKTPATESAAQKKFDEMAKTPPAEDKKGTQSEADEFMAGLGEVEDVS
jgi:hypothetical protein